MLFDKVDNTELTAMKSLAVSFFLRQRLETAVDVLFNNNATGVVGKVVPLRISILSKRVLFVVTTMATD